LSVPKRLIVIYGASIFLSGIAATLRANPALEIVEMRLGEKLSSLGTTQPSIVLVDSAQTSPGEIAALMAACSAWPGLPFLSLDATNQQLTIHASRQYPAASLSDLAQVLDKLSITLPDH
jgi:hypothetical protein